MTDQLDQLQQAKTYLKPGETAPKGVVVKKGKNGGRYYESSARQSVARQPRKDPGVAEGHWVGPDPKTDKKFRGQLEDSLNTPEMKAASRLEALETGEQRDTLAAPWDTFDIKPSELTEMKENYGGDFGRLKVEAISSVASTRVRASTTFRLLDKKELPPVTVIKDSNGKYLAVGGIDSLVAAWARKDKYVPVEMLEEDADKDSHYFHLPIFDDEDPNGSVEATKRVKDKITKKTGDKIPSSVKTIHDLEDYLNEEYGEGSAEYYDEEGDLNFSTPKKRKFKARHKKTIGAEKAGDKRHKLPE